MKNILVYQILIDCDKDYYHSVKGGIASITSYAQKYGMDYHLQKKKEINYYHESYLYSAMMEVFSLLNKKFDVYDGILYFDTDIIALPSAPDIRTIYDGSSLFAAAHEINNMQETTLNEWFTFYKKYDPHLENYQQIKGFQWKYINSGVMLFTKKYRQFLRGLEPHNIPFSPGKGIDQSILSYINLRYRIETQYLNWRFNLHPRSSQRNHAYFLHYMNYWKKLLPLDYSLYYNKGNILQKNKILLKRKWALFICLHVLEKKKILNDWLLKFNYMIVKPHKSSTQEFLLQPPLFIRIFSALLLKPLGYTIIRKK